MIEIRIASPTIVWNAVTVYISQRPISDITAIGLLVLVAVIGQRSGEAIRAHQSISLTEIPIQSGSAEIVRIDGRTNGNPSL